MTLHDVTFADGSQSRVGAAWIARWPEDILEVDGEPFTQPGTAAPDTPEPETDTPEPETDTPAPEPDSVEPEPDRTEQADPGPDAPETVEAPAADPAADAPTQPAARRSRASSNRKRVAS
ncbi:MAG: hypothetical protein D3X82_16885 [Candidatus Leucobacter sulfamidivorax]|nr:hypothetical protein [Candidatus Leucobacter sulfamidivorax]